MNKFVQESDSQFKHIEFDAVRIYHGGYDNVMFYTVALLKQKNVYHVGIAKVNIEKYPFSRPLGRKIAVGRALFQAGVFGYQARRRIKFINTEQGPMVDNSKPVNAVTIPIGMSDAAELSKVASNLLKISVPEFLFKPPMAAIKTEPKQENQNV